MKNSILLFVFLFNIVCIPQNNPQWMIFNSINSNLPSNQISDIVIDNLNRKWISIPFYGLLRIEGDNWTYFNTDNSELPSNYLQTINVDYESRFWGVSYGVFKLARFDGNEWKILDTSNIQIPEQNVNSLVFDSQNHLWFLCGNDFFFTGTNYLFELVSDTSILLQSSFNTSKGKRMMEFDSDDLLKIGDWRGIYFFHNDSLQYVQTPFGSLGSYVTDIKKDLNGNIWTATGEAGWGQLNKFDGSSFTIYPEITAISIEVDSLNNIWVGTLGKASDYAELIKFDGTNWISFNPSNSQLPQTFVINDLAFDKFGNLWLATENAGVVVFNENGVVIPVELTSFTSSVNENEVTLNWQTATETNNSGFEIQRNTHLNPLSRGEAEGRGVWRNIGFINGNGTTTEPQSYSFVDKELEAGKYQYRLKQIDFDGTFEYSKTIEVEVNAPLKFSLEQNYPNPFNPSTTIKFSIPAVGTRLALSVQLKVYDVLGKEIATLVNEEKPAGNYEVEFNSVETLHVTSLPSGVYFYQLKTEDFIQTNKMILMK
jgi:ligand-binding sensor domain-containing protein